MILKYEVLHSIPISELSSVDVSTSALPFVSSHVFEGNKRRPFLLLFMPLLKSGRDSNVSWNNKLENLFHSLADIDRVFAVIFTFFL